MVNPGHPLTGWRVFSFQGARQGDAMEKQEADDLEYQALVQRHKAEIEASGMSRDELINLLARNLASYNFLCHSYENNCRQLEETIKIRAQICDLLEQKNASTEEKFFAAVNALPKAAQAGMQAIRAEVSGGNGGGFLGSSARVRVRANKKADSASRGMCPATATSTCACTTTSASKVQKKNPSRQKMAPDWHQRQQ